MKLTQLQKKTIISYINLMKIVIGTANFLTRYGLKKKKNPKEGDKKNFSLL